MKTVKSKFSFLAIALVSIVMLGLWSCSKSSSSSTPVITPIGGFVSSDSVESGSLIAYWPFDGDANDHKGGLTGTATGVTYTTGIRGQAYQGAAGANVQYTLGSGSAFDTLPSYSISVWFNEPNQVTSPNHGIFHMYGASDWNLLELEFEPDSTTAADSILVHAGFLNPDAPSWKGIVPAAKLDTAVGKWVHLVVTYNGGTSMYTLYQDGQPVAVQTAWTGGLSMSPVPIWTDGTATTPMGNIGFSAEEPVGITIGSFPPSIVASNTWAGSFLGKMDELRVYNIALTQKDVSGLYLNGLAGR